MIPADKLEEIRKLYEHSQYLDAHTLAQAYGDYRDWTTPRGRVMAARLVSRLGSDRGYDVIITRAYRAHRFDPEIGYYYGGKLYQRYGIVRTLQWADRYEPESMASDVVRADWLGFRSRLYGNLRDFDVAHKHLDQALSLVGDTHPWVHVEHSFLLLTEDRYEEAMVAIEQSLALQGNYRPALQQKAHLLSLHKEAEEARQFLIDYQDTHQSGEIFSQMVDLDLILEDYDSAARHLERSAELLPLADKKEKEWQAARWTGIHAHREDWEQVIAKAKEATGNYFEKVAENVEANAETGKRVLLEVGFQRQHHVTCAPATLTVLSRFWDREVDHLEISEDICYDGTPGHKSRSWAEEEGWLVREFTLTQEVAVQLIDRGLPFALSTIEPGSGHMQAVIGYDGRMGTLLVRDPYIRQLREFLFREALEHYESTGPACLLMAPPEQAGAIADIEFPDGVLYDDSYRLSRALFLHERAEAQAALADMEQRDPEHRLTLLAGSSLASYDGDAEREAGYMRRLHEKYPKDINIFLRLYYVSHALVSRTERLDMLKTMALEKDSSPLVWQEYADELRLDARDLKEAYNWLRKALRYEPSNSRHHYTLAGVYWDMRRFDEALPYYRAAATIADRNENYSTSYFIACRHFKATDEAMHFLHRRFERFGHQSGGPAQTLFWAHECLDEELKGFEVLREGLKKDLDPPDLANLQLYTADSYGQHGRFKQAQELIDAAHGKSHPETWLHYQADLHLYQAQYEKALACYEKIFEIAPTNLAVIRSMARLTGQLKGEPEAIAFLEHCVDRFPYFQGLHEVYLGWLPKEDIDRKLEAVRKIIAINPRDAWAQRELVSLLTHKGDFDAAFTESVRAKELDPHDDTYYNIYGKLCESARRIDEAKKVYRTAIELRVDNHYAAVQWLNLCSTSEETRAALDFIHKELETQVIFGDGLLNWKDSADQYIEAGELLARLQEARKVRPDLWHTWVACAQQLSAMHRFDEAQAIAVETAERFPLLPRVWIELAEVYRVQLNVEAEREAINKALEISPGWERAIIMMADSYERQGEFEEARHMVERALRHDRLSARNYGYLASYEWVLGEREQALSHIEQAIELEPSYDWAWGRLADWTEEFGQPERCLEFGRKLTGTRPGDPVVWINYSYCLHAAEDFEERLAAVDKAIELQPGNSQWHVSKAHLLSMVHQFDEAIAVCEDPRWGSQVPADLQYRRMIIEDDRGNREDSRTLLEDFLKEHPDAAGGWRRLADYHREAGRKEEYLETCDRVIETAPHDALSYGYRISANLEMDQIEKIEDDCIRAISLDPTYVFAGEHLVSWYLKEERYNAVRDILKRVEAHWAPDTYHFQLLRVEMGERKYIEGKNLLLEMIRLPLVGQQAMEDAGSLFFEADKGDELFEMLHRAIDQGEVNETAAKYWGWLCSHLEKDRLALRYFKRADFGTETACKAAEGYIERLGMDDRSKQLRAALKRLGPKLGATTELWGATGHSMQQCHLQTQHRDWMVGIESREGIKASMICDYVISSAREGKLDEVVPLLQRALELPPDYTWEFLLTFQALTCIRHGDLEQAQSIYDHQNPGLLTDYYQAVNEMIGHTLHIMRNGSDPGPSLLAINKIIETQSKEQGADAFRRKAEICVDAISQAQPAQAGWARKTRKSLKKSFWSKLFSPSGTPQGTENAKILIWVLIGIIFLVWKIFLRTST